MRPLTVSVLLTVLLMAAAMAQPSADIRAGWEGVRNNVLRAAEKMPEENFAFKPVPEVRSFGQLIGHVADAQYMICGAAKGEKRSPAGIEKSKTSKADLVAALKESNDYCDAVYAATNEANAAEKISMFGRERSRLGALVMNTSHSNEHYGNMVTYMRMKGLVPPSSEPRKK